MSPETNSYVHIHCKFILNGSLDIEKKWLRAIFHGGYFRNALVEAMYPQIFPLHILTY